VDHKLKLISVRTDSEGMCIDHLRELLSAHRAAKSKDECSLWHPLIYIIPTHHNPTSKTWSAKRREELGRLAASEGALVLADEVYQMLSFPDSSPPPPPMLEFERSDIGSIISLGSFSKIFAPGVRLGWVQVAKGKEKLISKFHLSGVVQSGGGLNPFTSAIMKSGMELGLLGEQLDSLRESYALRAKTLHGALVHNFSSYEGFQVEEAAGGFFLWMRLPKHTRTHRHIDAKRFKDFCAQDKIGVSFKEAALFLEESRGQSDQDEEEKRSYVRLSFAFYPVEDLEESAKRLRKALDQFCCL
jgi:2-aminoadipate transaminase